MTLGQAARHQHHLPRLRHGQTGARHGPCQEGHEPRSGQHLDGLFGSRSKYLLRLNMSDLTQTKRRTDWVQCGCFTTAMDVDNDGRWDFFAGSGDDISGKGVLHRYDPVTLETIWSHKTNDNASSADPVLADIDGDGQVEILCAASRTSRCQCARL